MDANGHRFWLRADADQFDLAPGGLAWDAGCRSLTLAGRVDAFDTAGPRSAALAMADLAPTAIDGYGGYARVTAGGRVLVSGSIGLDLPETTLATLPAGTQVRDLCIDGIGTLRLAGQTPQGEGMSLIDLRGRWAVPIFLPTPDAAPDRIASGGGQVWLLERSSGRLWTQTGAPLTDVALRAPADHIFRPRPEYATPPRLVEVPAVALAPGERIACMAAAPDGSLAVLVLDIPQRPQSRVVLVPPRGARRSLAVPTPGFAGQIGWVAPDRLALLYPAAPRALVLTVGASLTPAPNRHPLRGTGPLRLARGDALPCAYVREGVGPRPLHALSLPGFGNSGRALAAPIDSGAAGFVWHRLVVEGDFPPGTGLTVRLRAADDPADLHAAPVAVLVVADAPVAAEVPRAAWLPEPSELPFHPGLLGGDTVSDRRGAFTVLIQRAGTQTRELAGRHLACEVTLHGNGQAAPRVAALRVWGGRFSLTRAYLPPVFHAPDDPALAGAPGAAHPRDFADRFVAMFEDVLTRIEDKVAAAPLLTAPHAAPEAALEWLAGWIGLTLHPGLTPARRRALLANGMRLHRRRGTLGGLMLALDIATGGEATRGGVVAVEDHRLTRVFATVLGANLGTDFDPLLAGPVESGNSFVGPTLFLTDAAGQKGELSAAQTAELAALLRRPGDRDGVEAARGFLGALAHRVTLLVHADLPTVERDLVEAIARELTPAHVALRIERASRGLILGLSSLLGVETYLRPRPAPGPVVIDHSLVGGQDLVLGAPGLDPRLTLGNPGDVS